MEVIGREELKENYPDIIRGIQKRHQMHPDVPIELFERNKPVKGLTHIRCYFVSIASDDEEPDIYMQYAMRYVIKDPKLRLVGRAVDEIILYESYQEFESARVRHLSSVKPSDQEGLNLN